MQYSWFALACLGLAFPIAAQNPNALTDQEKREGFQQLCDGTLESFRANFVDYRQRDSTTTTLSPAWTYDRNQQAVVTNQTTTDIRSKAQYADFDLRIEYKNTGNQGIYYRFNLNESRGWETGVEYAIEDDASACKSCAGAAYDLYPPLKPAYYPFSTGKWNSARIVVIKDSVEHWLNGERVVAYRYHSPDFWDRFNKSKWNAMNILTMKVPGDRNGGYIESGYIGMQGGKPGFWSLRNIRINTKTPYFGPVRDAASLIDPGSRTPPLLSRSAPAGEGSSAALFGWAQGLRSVDGRAAILPRANADRMRTGSSLPEKRVAF